MLKNLSTLVPTSHKHIRNLEINSNKSGNVMKHNKIILTEIVEMHKMRLVYMSQLAQFMLGGFLHASLCVYGHAVNTQPIKVWSWFHLYLL